MEETMSRTIRVLLADDHPVVREGVRNLLERAPDMLIVGEVGSGEAALDSAKALAPDVLVLDMEMPGLSGVDVARHLREQNVPVRILALSAYDDSQYVFGVLDSGAAGYLLKEEAPDAIIAAVRGVACGQGGWISRRVVQKVMQRARGTQQNACPLTPRELEVLQCAARGLTGPKIANELGISQRTVAFHLENVFQKLHVSNRTEAVVQALEQAWLDL